MRMLGPLSLSLILAAVLVFTPPPPLTPLTPPPEPAPTSPPSPPPPAVASALKWDALRRLDAHKGCVVDASLLRARHMPAAPAHENIEQHKSDIVVVRRGGADAWVQTLLEGCEKGGRSVVVVDVTAGAAEGEVDEALLANVWMRGKMLIILWQNPDHDAWVPWLAAQAVDAHVPVVVPIELHLGDRQVKWASWDQHWWTPAGRAWRNHSYVDWRDPGAVARFAVDVQGGPKFAEIQRAWLADVEPPLKSSHKSSHNDDGVFFAAVWKNVAVLWYHLREELIAFLQELQRRNVPVFVAIHISNSDFLTNKMMLAFRNELATLGFPHDIEVLSRGDTEAMRSAAPNRQSFLATLRNRCLRQLTPRYARVFWMNDVLSTAADMLALLETPVEGGQEYDMACALDFSHDRFNLRSDLTLERGRHMDKQLCFYDVWVSQDADGHIFTSRWPWVVRDDDQAAVRSGRPFHVRACWNGMVAIRSEPFWRQLVRFRGHDEQYECVQSESHTICRDLWLHGFRKFFVNPRVRVAYNAEVYQIVLEEGRALWDQGFQASESVFGELKESIMRLPQEREVCCNPKDPSMSEPDHANCKWHPTAPRHVLALFGDVFPHISLSYVNQLLASSTDRFHLDTLLFSRPLAEKDHPHVQNDMILKSWHPVYSAATYAALPATNYYTLYCGWPPRPALWEKARGRRFGAYLFWERGSFPEPWLHALEQDFPEADVVLASQDLRRHIVLDGVSRHRLFFLPTPIDVPFFDSSSSSSKSSSKGDDTFWLTYVGSFTPRKNIDMLLDAYAEAFTAQDDDVCLWVVTSHSFGADVDRLNKWNQTASNPCLWWRPGHKTRTDILNHFRDTDVILFPSRSEGFGMPVVEAMVIGKPVITSDGSSLTDLADPDVSILVDAVLDTCFEFPCQALRHNVCVFGSADNTTPCAPTRRTPQWLAINQTSLVQAMRSARDRREELHRRALAHRKWAMDRWSPESASYVVADGIIGRDYPANRHLTRAAQSLKTRKVPFSKAVNRPPVATPENTQILNRPQRDGFPPQHPWDELDPPVTEERFAEMLKILRGNAWLHGVTVVVRLVQREIQMDVAAGCEEWPWCREQLDGLQLLLERLVHSGRRWSLVRLPFLVVLDGPHVVEQLHRLRAETSGLPLFLWSAPVNFTMPVFLPPSPPAALPAAEAAPPPTDDAKTISVFYHEPLLCDVSAKLVRLLHVHHHRQRGSNIHVYAEPLDPLDGQQIQRHVAEHIRTRMVRPRLSWDERVALMAQSRVCLFTPHDIALVTKLSTAHALNCTPLLVVDGPVPAKHVFPRHVQLRVVHGSPAEAILAAFSGAGGSLETGSGEVAGLVEGLERLWTKNRIIL